MSSVLNTLVLMGLITFECVYCKRAVQIIHIVASATLMKNCPSTAMTTLLEKIFILLLRVEKMAESRVKWYQYRWTIARETSKKG